MPYFPGMTAAARLKITAKGQVTFRKELLRHLDVRPGESIDVKPQPDGTLRVAPAAKPGARLEDLYGALHHPDNPVLTIDEMNEVIAKSWAGEFED